MKNNKSAGLIIFSLLTFVGYIAKLGIVYSIAFSLVFTIFDLLLLIFIKKKLEELYGKSRAINMYVYGLSLIVLLVFLLLLFGV